LTGKPYDVTSLVETQQYLTDYGYVRRAKSHDVKSILAAGWASALRATIAAIRL
jgi:hypothetical protein